MKPGWYMKMHLIGCSITFLSHSEIFWPFFVLLKQTYKAIKLPTLQLVYTVHFVWKFTATLHYICSHSLERIQSYTGKVTQAIFSSPPLMPSALSHTSDRSCWVMVPWVALKRTERTDWFLHFALRSKNTSALRAVEAGSGTLELLRNDNNNKNNNYQQKSMFLMGIRKQQALLKSRYVFPGTITCLWGTSGILVSPHWQDNISVFHQHHSLNMRTQRKRSSAAQTDASDKGDITYSEADINLDNTEELVNQLDAAERDDLYSLNGHCAPPCTVV